MKSILEDLDDAQYYGSDHDERESRAAHGAEAKETVEEELARLVRGGTESDRGGGGGRGERGGGGAAGGKCVVWREG